MTYTRTRKFLGWFFLCSFGFHDRQRGVTGYVDRCSRCRKFWANETFNHYTPY